MLSRRKRLEGTIELLHRELANARQRNRDLTVAYKASMRYIELIRNAAKHLPNISSLLTNYYDSNLRRSARIADRQLKEREQKQCDLMLRAKKLIKDMEKIIESNRTSERSVQNLRAENAILKCNMLCFLHSTI